MLTNFELESMAKFYNIPLKGVFQKDLLPYPPTPGNYIVNLQSSFEGSGTHYTCFILDDKKMRFIWIHLEHQNQKKWKAI